MVRAGDGEKFRDGDIVPLYPISLMGILSSRLPKVVHTKYVRVIHQAGTYHLALLIHEPVYPV